MFLKDLLSKENVIKKYKLQYNNGKFFAEMIENDIQHIENLYAVYYDV